MVAACSTTPAKSSSPEQKLAQARNEIKKKQYEVAYGTLEELRYVTTGTRLGGEVQFLLGEVAFKRAKYPEAESHYQAYLNTYRNGPFAEQSLYMQAQSKLKQIEKRRLGFFSFPKFIPHDRDISLLRETRILFDLYRESYPDGKWIVEAARLSEELLVKEGEHELEIAVFYLKRKSPRSALARAERVLNDNSYPESIRNRAREVIREAEESLPLPGDDENP